MATLYEELQEDASALIKEFGRDLVVRRTANVSADPTKPWRVTSSTSTDFPAVGVVQAMAANLREGKKLSRGDFTVILASKDLPDGVLETDFIVDGSVVLSVQNVVEIKPGPLGLVFKVIARQWPPRSSS